MTSDANLLSVRLKHINGKWIGASKSGKLLCSSLNLSMAAESFQHEAETFVGRSLSGISDMTLAEMTAFVKKRDNQYIHESQLADSTHIVQTHYLASKRKCVHYIQLGDSFYRISDVNPLKLSGDIPQFAPMACVKIRVAIRSSRYEILSEVKMLNRQSTDYSIYPFSSKKNPLNS